MAKAFSGYTKEFSKTTQVILSVVPLGWHQLLVIDLPFHWEPLEPLCLCSVSVL